MIRRGFWLLAGAAAGIMGYRRAASLGRQLSGTVRRARTGAVPGAGAERADGRPGRAARRRLVRETIRLTRDVRGFSRDVQEGMDLYLARHPGGAGPTLGASTDSASTDSASTDSASTDSASTDSASTGNDEREKDDR